MSDKLVLEGVFSKGYGTVPKMVMKDEDLTIEAKGIYAYLCSYAGAGETAFPSVSLMCKDLGISDNRLYKHRKLLVDKGYLRIERERLENGFSKNIYTISSVVHLQNEGIPNEPVDLQNVGIGNVDIQNLDIGNEGTNNNSLNNNSFNNNNINNSSSGSSNNKNINKKEKSEKINSDQKSKTNVHKFYQANFGLEPPTIAEDLEYWIKDLNEELVILALQKTIEHEKTYSYAKGIMKKWTNKGIETVADVEAQELSFQRQNSNGFAYDTSSQEDISDIGPVPMINWLED